MHLTGVVFVLGMINSYFTPDRTRALLAGRTEGVANVMAASLGIVTPFCSCSAVPLFIGFVQAGVPLGVTFSFLISAPMVNEVALALLFGMFGWKVAAMYLGLGLSVAIVAGWTIVQALLAKGAALGTVLAFMMSVIALSLPEMIILRKLLKVRLIATFVAVVATGILIVGFVFNAVL